MCSRARGPASDPSLVTWPTSTVATWRALASPTSWSAHSRTWVDAARHAGGPPLAGGRGADGHGLDGVDDHQVGLGLGHRRRSPRRRRWPAGSAAPAGSGPRRSARSRTWWADSSADTSSTRCPAAARAASTWRSRVDLPMPGSPPSRVTEPGTSPPDRTRSNSLHARSGRPPPRTRPPRPAAPAATTGRGRPPPGPAVRAGPPPPGCSTPRRSGSGPPTGRWSIRSRCSGGAWPSWPSPRW